MSERCLSCMKPYEGEECPHCGYPNAVSTLPHQLPVGTVLRERYQVGRVLGQGGFGITYLAWDGLLQKEVAIKEFFPGGTVQRNCAMTTRVECIYTSTVEAYSRSTERFLREAQALVQFRDIPQVVDIQDFLKENNTAYIVMEYVKGVDLAKYVQGKGGRLEPEEAFRILRPVMEALAKVHKGGIVHRDISPDNIILDPLGGAKLLDFGAVRAVENPDAEKALEKSTEAILKRGFAPLEQYNSRGSLGPWTDVYAMCATVWYCLTGRIPEDASIRMTEGTDPDWASIPGLTPSRQAALAKGIACRPKDRYPDMDSLLQALFPDEQPVPAPEPVKPIPEPPKPKPEPPKPKHPKPEPKKPAPREKKADAKPAPGNGKGKKLWVPLVAGLALVTVIGTVVFTRLPSVRYAKAEGLMEDGEFAKAAALFEGLEGYEDSEKMAKHCGYRLAGELADQGSYQEAAEIFDGLAGYSDSGDQAVSCRYLLAEELFSQGRYEEAAEIYTALGTYGDSAGKLAQCRGQLDYPTALALLERKDYAGAAALFETMEGYMDSTEKLTLCRNWLSYESAQEYQVEGRYYDAAVLFYSLGEFEDAWEQCFACWDQIVVRDTACVYGDSNAAFLQPDGTVTVVGIHQDDVIRESSSWQDIVAISYSGDCLVGLKADGTVVATSRLESYWQQQSSDYQPIAFDVSGWTDIVSVSVQDSYIVGLKADGTVVATGKVGSEYYDNSLGSWEYMAFDFSGWTGIVSLDYMNHYAVGLRADGTVMVTGKAGSEYYDHSLDSWEYMAFDFSGWTGIVSLYYGDRYAVGLRADGTVMVTGKTGFEYYDNSLDSWEYMAFDLSHWTDIVSLCYGDRYVIGLRADGTVVTTDSALTEQVSGWQDIVELYRYGQALLGLKADGTVVYADASGEGASDAVSAITQWQDIAALRQGSGYLIGLRTDGTVVVEGRAHYYRESWATHGYVGTYVTFDTSDWQDIVAVYPGYCYILGVKADGTILFTGHISEVPHFESLTNAALPKGR